MAASAGAWYRVGTVNVTNGSAAIVGVGSNWQNDVIAIAIGDAFTIDAKTWYEVIAVNSDTSITLDRGFEGSTDNGVEYAILRNTSGTILTRIAGQIAVQFNQKQLFLDELRNWLTSEDDTATLTDSHGIEHVVKTVNKIQELTGTAATHDVTTSRVDKTSNRLLRYADFGIGTASGVTMDDLDNNDLGFGAWYSLTSETENSHINGKDFNGFVIPIGRAAGARLNQIAMDGENKPTLYTRNYNSGRPEGSRWTEWLEYKHSGNTNFTTLKGEKAGDQFGAIVFRNTNSVFLVKDLSGYTSAPSSITCTGTFKITNQSGVDRITGITASDLFLDVLTSNKRLKVKVLNIDPAALSFGGDDTYELCAETDGSNIEVNP